MIELLIVIMLIGVLLSFLGLNWVSIRSRGADHKKKVELTELQKALQIYQQRFGHFPKTGNGLVFNACGPTGTQSCPVCPTADFAVGGPDGCALTLMPRLSRAGRFFTFRYYPCQDGTTYRIKVQLDNASDSEIQESQERCPASTCGLSYNNKEYVVCYE
jgi:type II secretory pathway pseudopilin PulG